MTIDKEKLKALAEAATQSHGPRRVEVDHNGRHVIGDGSWKILSAWHTPDGKGAQNAEFAAAASPSAVLALLAEIERLEREADQAKADGADAFGLAQGRADTIDQLKAENEALRKSAGLAAILPQLDEALEDLELHGRHTDQGYRKLKDWYRKVKLACDSIDAAMAKETSHG